MGGIKVKSRKRKILFQVLKNPAIYKLLAGYFITFFVIALVIFLREGKIRSYGDALWYCFVSCTTIGFGDLVVSTLISKILTVVLYLYSIIIIAVVTAVITQYFIEIAKNHRDESVSLFLDDLENLSSLPPERLDELSAKVRELRRR